jgi:hypothetical protein
VQLALVVPAARFTLLTGPSTATGVGGTVVIQGGAGATPGGVLLKDGAGATKFSVDDTTYTVADVTDIDIGDSTTLTLDAIAATVNDYDPSWNWRCYAGLSRL